MDTLETLSVPPEAQSASTELSEQKDVVKGRWLVFSSVILVFTLEVYPIEAGLLYGLVREGNILNFWATKAIILAVILLPLGIFFRINGFEAYAAVRWRLLIITTIIVLNLLGNFVVFFRDLYA